MSCEKKNPTQILKKEVVRLTELCRLAAEEIKYLDDILMSCYYGNKPPPVNDPVDFGTFTSINLLSRLEGRLGPSIQRLFEETDGENYTNVVDLQQMITEHLLPSPNKSET